MKEEIEREKGFLNLDEDERKAIKGLKRKNKWFYFGKNFSKPEYNTIAFKTPAEKGEFLNAAKVFMALGLDLEELSQIFVQKPENYYTVREEDREHQPTAKSYQDLGTCRAWDDDGWLALAMLSGKTIDFVHCHGEPMGVTRAVYKPNGKFEILSS